MALNRPTNFNVATVADAQAIAAINGYSRSHRRRVAENNPTFDLNFTALTLPANVTHSRASAALQYNSAGMLTWARNNAVAYSENFSNVGWNALDANTTLALETVDVPPGFTQATRVTQTGGGYGGAFETAGAGRRNLVVNARYTVSFWAKSISGNTSFDIGGAGVSITTSWTRVRCDVTAGSDAPSIYNVANSVWLIAGIQYERVFVFGAPLSYLSTSGAQFLGPRFDYRPGTLAFRGLLLEPQRTNLVAQSNLSAPWGLTNVTRTLSAGTSPTGLGDATKISETAVNADHAIDDAQVNVAANTPIAITVYAKAAERNFVCLQWNDSTTTNAVYCAFNLTTGAVSQAPTMLLGTFTNMRAYTEQCPNGWWRCHLLLTTNSVANGVFYVGLSNDGTTRSYLGVGGSGILLFGAQSEVGDTNSYQATSFIPTAGVAATRASDKAVADSLAPLFSVTQGTVLSISEASPSPVTTYPFVASWGEGNYVNFRSVGLKLDSVTTSSAFAQTVGTGVGYAGSSVVASLATKSAGAYAPLRQAVSIAGQTTIESAAAAGAHPAATRFSIGGYPAPGGDMAIWPQWIQRFTYWNRARSNAELQTLSA